MPEISFGDSAYDNESFGLPPIRLENWFVEEAEDRRDWGARLIPTPGLVTFSQNSALAGRGVFQSDAINNGDIIKVRGSKVVRVNSSGLETELSGTIASNTVPVAFASSQSQLVVVSAGRAYTVGATNFVDITTAITGAGATGNIIDVAVYNNRHLFVEDNSGRIFYSDPGNAGSIAGFATAEQDPDQLQAVLSVGSSVLLFGSRKTEFWIGTTSDTTPLIPRQGFVLEVGIINPYAKDEIGSEAYWVGNDSVAYRWSGGREEKISAPWMDRAIGRLSLAQKGDIRVTTHSFGGHRFAKFYIPTVGDYFFDTRLKRWHRRKSLGATEAHWGYDFFVEAFGNVYVQKLATGRLYRLDGSVFTEDGQKVRRVASALVPVKSSTRISNVIIEGQPSIGVDGTTNEEGEPTAMLKVYYDGYTGTQEMRRSLGRIGDYRWRPVFGSQGTVRPPAALVEVAYADAVGWSIYGATYNEPVN